MQKLAYYGGMAVIVFGLWIWATSGYDGCDMRTGDCSIFSLLKIPAIQGVIRNFLAFAVIIGGWGLMKWAANLPEENPSKSPPTSKFTKRDKWFIAAFIGFIIIYCLSAL